MRIAPTSFDRPAWFSEIPRRIALFAALAIALSANTAGSQVRPTLERIETYLCHAADAAGSSYRGTFCSPRCDCITGSVPATASCVQNPSGVVRVTANPMGPSSGSCLGYCLADPSKGCEEDSDCPGTGSARCSLPLGVGNCVVTSMQCTSDAQCDQAKGYTCQSQVQYPDVPFQGMCQRTNACSAPGSCDSNIQSFRFAMNFDFLPPPDATPLSCVEGTTIPYASFAGSLNSVDIATCISTVEAAIGAGACVICGDGNVDTGEQCDDGNLDPGDGCDVSCQTE